MDSTSISSAILKVTEQLDVIIQTVKPLVENSVTSFVAENVKKLALIGTYANFFSELNVDGRDDAEKVWERALIRDSEIEEKVDLLLDKEKEFDEFLESLDQRWRIESGGIFVNNDSMLQTGDIFPNHIKFKNIEKK